MRQHINDLRYIKPCKRPEEIHRLTGVPRTTVIDICERDEHLLRRERPNRAPEFKISREKVLEIEADMDGHWGRGSMTTQELIDLYDLDCCPQTLLNAFRREGIGHFWAAEDKYLTDKNMDDREEFCRELRDVKKWRLPQYKKVLYSDACHFAVNQQTKKKVWRRRGRDPRTKKLHRNRLDKTHKRFPVEKVSWTIAAMVGWNYKSPIAFLPRHINGDDYVKHFLKPIVKPFFDKQREEGEYGWIFQEDNEGAHGTGSVLNAPNDFKNKCRIRQLKPRHPPNSPDLSPIENVWRVVKQRVKRRKAKNERELRRFIEEEWDRVTIKEINKYILTMEERIDQCIEREGDITEF
jgi:hypothetical protein